VKENEMALFKVVVEAFVASRELDQASLSRLAYWVDVLGDREIAAITADDIDIALVKLAERGRLKAGRRMPTAASGKPLAGSTVNRYLTQAGSIFKHAKRLKLVPRSFIAPTRGIERTPERPDPERYLRPEEVERVLAVARVMDRTWRKIPALITVAYHTGLRVGSILRVRGRDLDLDAGTLTIARTKNGDPITAGLSSAAIAELKRLPKVGPDELIFGNRGGKPYTYTPLWRRIANEARLEGRVFHELRHGHGYLLARAGVSQQMIMQSMGHKTLSASARYAHASVADKKAVIERVFG
jgi:integrase